MNGLSFRPAAWYYRNSIHQSQTLEGAKRVGLWVVEEVAHPEAPAVEDPDSNLSI
jgi:hypothetical protein